MDQHLSESTFGVEQLSKEIGISTVYLNKKISAMTGKTTSEYVRSLRIKKGAACIAVEDSNVDSRNRLRGRIYRTQVFLEIFLKRNMACCRLNIERIISEKHVVVNRSGEVLLSYKKYNLCIS